MSSDLPTTKTGSDKNIPKCDRLENIARKLLEEMERLIPLATNRQCMGVLMKALGEAEAFALSTPETGRTIENRSKDLADKIVKCGINQGQWKWIREAAFFAIREAVQAEWNECRGKLATVETRCTKLKADRAQLLQELKNARGTLEMSHVFTVHRYLGNAIAKSEALDQGAQEREKKKK